jgi:hypothetical protein
MPVHVGICHFVRSAKLRYQKVLWHHDLPDEPVVLYAEISSGREVRKVEVFRDGRHDYAGTSGSTWTTMQTQVNTGAPPGT